jgi:hypothetical protein
MLIFGLAVILLVASIGIIGSTLARRSSAEQARDPGLTPTAFVALVETPVPTPQTGLVTPTVRTTATARGVASPTLGPTARVTRTTTSTGTLGSGQGAGARGLAGSMAIALGGTLPPVEAAVPPTAQPTAAQPAPTQPSVAQTTPPTPTPRPSGGTSSGGGSSSNGGSAPGGGSSAGGGSPSGGGSTAPQPTPTRYVAPPLPPTPTVYVQPTVTPTPTQVPLPAAVLPGPGSRTYSYNLIYTQNADLTTIPQSDFAYGATYKTYTAGDAATLKAALGLSGQVEQTGDGFRITGPGTLIISNTTGSLTYTAASGADEPQLQALALPTRAPITPITEASVTPAASTAPSSSPAPSASPAPGRGTGTPAPSGTPTPVRLTDEAAIAAAKKAMTAYGLLPTGIDTGRVTRPTAEQVVVTFHPVQPGSLIPQDPMVRVVLAQDGTMKSFYERWPTALTAQPTLLRDPNIAWAEIATGGGYLEVDQTIPSDLPANTIFRGAATVTKVSLGWAPGATGTTNYLVPLYVFEGTVTLINPPTGQPATVPFRVYVGAAQP